MNLFFRWQDFLLKKAIVKDENDEFKYRVERKNFLSMRLKVYDNKNNLLFYKDSRGFKSYIFDADHKVVAKIRYKFSLLGISFKIDLLNWTFKGDPYNRNFHVTDSSGNSIAYIKNKFMSANYDIDVLDEKNEPIVIALSLILLNVRSNSISFLGVKLK